MKPHNGNQPLHHQSMIKKIVCQIKSLYKQIENENRCIVFCKFRVEADLTIPKL